MLRGGKRDGVARTTEYSKSIATAHGARIPFASETEAPALRSTPGK